jgi:hypothetical protein
MCVYSILYGGWVTFLGYGTTVILPLSVLLYMDYGLAYLYLVLHFLERACHPTFYLYRCRRYP